MEGLTLLLCHLVGDYLLQSDWMAAHKRGNAFVAFLHAITYTLPFWLCSATGILPLSISGLEIILFTHYLIDHFGAARYLVWAKNFLAPPSAWLPWSRCSATGYDADRPAWLAVWLLIIADNTLHLCINAGAYVLRESEWLLFVAALARAATAGTLVMYAITWAKGLADSALTPDK